MQVGKGRFPVVAEIANREQQPKVQNAAVFYASVVFLLFESILGYQSRFSALCSFAYI